MIIPTKMHIMWPLYCTFSEKIVSLLKQLHILRLTALSYSWPSQTRRRRQQAVTLVSHLGSPQFHHNIHVHCSPTIRRFTFKLTYPGGIYVEVGRLRLNVRCTGVLTTFWYHDHPEAILRPAYSFPALHCPWNNSIQLGQNKLYLQDRSQ